MLHYTRVAHKYEIYELDQNYFEGGRSEDVDDPKTSCLDF
jgi:hypothetical protein